MASGEWQWPEGFSPMRGLAAQVLKPEFSTQWKNFEEFFHTVEPAAAGPHYGKIHELPLRQGFEGQAAIPRTGVAGRDQDTLTTTAENGGRTPPSSSAP